MPTVNQHFVRRTPNVRATYDRILAVASAFGEVREDAKKTSIHLVNRVAFAGISTRRDVLILTVKSATDLASRRIVKREQTSANRWHLEIRLSDPEDVDQEIEEWLKTSYLLAA